MNDTIPEGYIHQSQVRDLGWTKNQIKKLLAEHARSDGNPNTSVSPYWYPESVVEELTPKLPELERQWQAEFEEAARAARAAARKASAEAKKQREQEIIAASGRTVIGKPLTITTYNPGVGVRNAGDVFTTTYENHSGRRFLVLAAAKGGWFIETDSRRVFGIKCRAVEVEPTPEELNAEAAEEREKSESANAQRYGKAEAQHAAGWDSSSDYFPRISPKMYQSYELGYRLDGDGGHDRLLKTLVPNGEVRLLLDVTPEHLRAAWVSGEGAVRESITRWAVLGDSVGTTSEIRAVLRELTA